MLDVSKREWRRVCAGNEIGAEGAKALSTFLPSLSQLTQLNLGGMFCYCVFWNRRKRRGGIGFISFPSLICFCWFGGMLYRGKV